MTGGMAKEQSCTVQLETSTAPDGSGNDRAIFWDSQQGVYFAYTKRCVALYFMKCGWISIEHSQVFFYETGEAGNGEFWHAEQASRYTHLWHLFGI